MVIKWQELYKTLNVDGEIEIRVTPNYNTTGES